MPMGLGAPLALVESRKDALSWEVPTHRVPADVRQACERARLEIASGLGLTPPKIRYLARVVFNLRGVTFREHPSEIWVRQQRPALAAETVGHEMRHAQQVRSCSRLDQHEREQEADRFGLEVRARFERGLPLVDVVPSADGAMFAPRKGTPKRSAAAPPRASTPAIRHRSPGPTAAALAERRAGLFEVKGRRCWRCNDCGEVTPVNVTHRCLAARGLVPRR